MIEMDSERVEGRRCGIERELSIVQEWPFQRENSIPKRTTNVE